MITCTVLNQEGGILHWDNMLQIHALQDPILLGLTDLDPIICGGYPMALLFGGRELGHPTQIVEGLYHDFDIYAKDTQHFKQLQEYLDDACEKWNKDESFLAAKAVAIYTENAISYSFPRAPHAVVIQLVRRTMGAPNEILLSFDFINCAIGFRPKYNEFYFHKSAPSYHANSQLEVLLPWMLADVKQEEDSYKHVVVQLLRFKKYCWRWGYTLAPDSFKLLLELYYQHPHINICKGSKYGVGSGSDLPRMAVKDQNLWTAMACIFKATSWWSDALDPYGLINIGSEEFEVTDQALEDQALSSVIIL